jgi:hypothetical protein
MLTIEGIIARCAATKLGAAEEHWLQLHADLIDFLNGDHPEADKKRLRKEHWHAIEIACMIYDGVCQKLGIDRYADATVYGSPTDTKKER